MLLDICASLAKIMTKKIQQLNLDSKKYINFVGIRGVAVRCRLVSECW